ncbi:ABC transporter permease [Pollutimonas bauzanensis]|uniref:ABC transporter permease n=1 Tax=Pollutimonas bauzanensis TaxID=658167 RepID=UPI003341BC4A
MLKFLLARLISTIPVLLIVAIVVFVILQLSPGDPAAIIAGDNATAKDLEQIRRSLGLDRSMIGQFAIWLGNVARGDLGYSYFQNKPVIELIMQRMAPTLSLALGTVVLALIVALPLGTIAAWRMGGWLDRGLTCFSVAGFAIPVFVVGYILIYLLAVQLPMFPIQGYHRLNGWSDLWPWASRLVLPWVTLGLVYMALIARITRASVSEALTEDYVRTARAKGLTETRVLVRHALANAAVPIVTIIGIGIASLISGVVVTETVFAIPGLGSLTVDSVLNRDFPVIQGLVLFFGVLYVVINLLVDLSYFFFDPRIRY